MFMRVREGSFLSLRGMSHPPSFADGNGAGMLTLEQLEQLTPERIKALSIEEKREALMLLEALQIPQLERLRRAVEKKKPEDQQKTGSTLSETIERGRKRLPL